MNKYSIRFNKSRGQPGRGSVDHVWRVFENGKEYLFKNLNINVGVSSEKDPNGQDYNIVCYGVLSIDKETSTAIISKEAPKTERTCDGCSECCNGRMVGSVYGHTFHPGKKCFYLKDGCSIYDTRPVNPCQVYKCHWLETEDLPVWMRPDLSRVIVSKRTHKPIEFYEVIECGQSISLDVFRWLTMWALGNNKNVRFEMSGGYNKIGSDEFLASTEV
jgi:hypothetical protein